MSYKNLGKEDEATLKVVAEKMTVAYDYSQALDTYFKQTKIEELKKEVEPAKNLMTPPIDYPEEEINAEDVPF